MALELNKLTKDVDALGQNLAERLAQLAERLPAAQASLTAIGGALGAIVAAIVLGLILSGLIPPAPKELDGLVCHAIVRFSSYSMTSLSME